MNKSGAVVRVTESRWDVQVNSPFAKLLMKSLKDETKRTGNFLEVPVLKEKQLKQILITCNEIIVIESCLRLIHPEC